MALPCHWSQSILFQIRSISSFLSILSIHSYQIQSKSFTFIHVYSAIIQFVSFHSINSFISNSIQVLQSIQSIHFSSNLIISLLPIISFTSFSIINSFILFTSTLIKFLVFHSTHFPLENIYHFHNRFLPFHSNSIHPLSYLILSTFFNP